MDVMLKVNFALSNNNKNQLRGYHNYLNQKLITAINTQNASMLGDNLIMSHQVNYMSSALFPAEAVENN